MEGDVVGRVGIGIYRASDQFFMKTMPVIGLFTNILCRYYCGSFVGHFGALQRLKFKVSLELGLVNFFKIRWFGF